MGDDDDDSALRSYRMRSRSRFVGEEKYSAQRGYAYAFNQSQNYKNDPRFEENLINPYLKQNQRNRSNLHQTKVVIGKEMLKKMENNRKSSPSVIAKLMGINEIPPQKGSYSNNKISGGSFRKIPEFKDVFEVIEERKKQQNRDYKGQNRKKFIKDQKFGDKNNNTFESYRDRFVKNLEKSNPLFAKHLIDLKCSEPTNLHKNPVFVQNPKMRNYNHSNHNYDYNDHDHIVLLDPKFGDFGLGPNLQRNFHRSFSDNLEKRRGENEKYIENFDKLRRIESSLGFYDKRPKTLAEMLAQSDSENHFTSKDSYKTKKVPKVKSSREINYEKDEGNFVILPRKNGLYERDDVAKLRARNKKLKQNLIFGRNFSAKKDNLRDFYENNILETEEKTLFTIDESQKVGLRSNLEETEGRFSKYCERLKKLKKETEQPSPVSVLESEQESSSSGFVKEEEDFAINDYVKDELGNSSFCFLKEEEEEDSALHDSDTQVTTEDPSIHVSSDEETYKDTNKYSTLNQLKDQEEREFSYLLDMLIQSGVYGPHIDSLRKACHKPTCPINPLYFDQLERKYNQVLTWSKSDRRLLFDCINLVLGLILGPGLNPHPWVRVRGERKVCGGWGKEGLLETVWLGLERERRRERGRDDDVADSDWLRDLGGDVNVVGKMVERMITDEILEETVLGFVCDL